MSLSCHGRGELKKAMDDFRQILRRYWGYPDFRGIQRDIIESVAAGHDTLGLMPTGGGKSVTFQVPTLAMEGMCLVITPLIALMKDQVGSLKRRGISASAIYSGLPHTEIETRLDNAIFGAYKFLYVSPERLVTTLFINKVRRMKVCLITVDEAHCISQWGYDFRPPYLRIAEVRRVLPGVPVLALTATATPRVVEDIQEKLGFPRPCVFKMSFARPNLHYIVRHTSDKYSQLLHILSRVRGAAIVYTRSRRGTREVASFLSQNNIGALFYHAGLTTLDKDTRQRAWQSGDVRVMVATNAFGMGIDKPDVRLVIHMDVPDCIESYFQEAGRGGRDGRVAYAVLLCDNHDAQRLASRIPQAFPDRDYIRKVYADLSSFYQIAEGEAEGRTFEFCIDRFCRIFHHYPVHLVSALNLLTQAGYIHFYMEDENPSRVIFLVRRDELYGITFTTPSEERVLNALLRSNGGFFIDYVAIEEDRIGEQCGMDADEVYQHLRHLTQLRVINYIPHKETPQITYTMRRVDTQYVEIPYEIYELRREQYRRRVDAMIKYFTRGDECRSRYLLHYFADETDDCGFCDVCIAREHDQSAPPPAPQIEEACRRLLQALSDGKPHALSELLPHEINPKVRDFALRQLVRDENIMVDGINVVLA